MYKQAASSSARAVARSIVSRRAGTIQSRSASGEAKYNQPSGNLFGEKPLPKGQKREKEGWEDIWYIGLGTGLGIGFLGYLFKPDTTIQTWARAEARKRLDASGEPWQYKPSPNSDYPNGI